MMAVCGRKSTTILALCIFAFASFTNAFQKPSFCGLQAPSIHRVVKGAICEAPAASRAGLNTALRMQEARNTVARTGAAKRGTAFIQRVIREAKAKPESKAKTSLKVDDPALTARIEELDIYNNSDEMPRSLRKTEVELLRAQSMYKTNEQSMKAVEQELLNLTRELEKLDKDIGRQKLVIVQTELEVEGAQNALKKVHDEGANDLVLSSKQRQLEQLEQKVQTENTTLGLLKTKRVNMISKRQDLEEDIAKVKAVLAVEAHKVFQIEARAAVERRAAKKKAKLIASFESH